MNRREPVLFTHWYEVTKWLLARTEKFPKRVRFTFSSRIDNLTSQHFANFYLSGLDHFIKERLRIPGYVRYMDDLILWADEKPTLRDALARVNGYLESELSLRVKHGSVRLAPVSEGLSFLGFRIFPGVIRIQRPGWRRFRRRVADREEKYSQGLMEEERFLRAVDSLSGHLAHARTRNLRARFFAQRPGAEVAPTG